MELVVDTNVIVAGFLRSAVTRELLLDERLTLWAPEHLLTEADRVLSTPRLRRRLGSLSAVDFRGLFSQLTARIHVVPISEFQQKLVVAKELIADPEDVPFLALALQLCLPLWSNDPDFKEQNVIQISTTDDVLNFLRERSSPSS